MLHQSSPEPPLNLTGWTIGAVFISGLPFCVVFGAYLLNLNGWL